MQQRNEEFLSKKLSELKRDARGIKALDLSAPGYGDGSLSEAARRPSDSERLVRYAVPKAAPQTGTSLRGSSAAHRDAFAHEYRPQIAESRPKPGSAGPNAPVRVGPSSAVFDQIYRNMETPPRSPLRESLPQTELSEKHEANLCQELEGKLGQETQSNQRLVADIATLRRTLEHEKAKTGGLEEQCRAELREAKARESEALSELAALERQAQELARRTRAEEERAARSSHELESVRRDNELLRSELKRLGDLTGEKVLELENGLNAVSRMREFEHANFEMEKGNIINTGEFVMEQMRVKFAERGARFEEQIREASDERDRAAAEARALLDELRGFNANAEARIHESISALVAEQKLKHETELGELNGRVRLEEEELAALQQRHKELLLRFQNVEREGKNRLIARKNENMRAKEELSAAEQQYNRLLVQLNAEAKESEKRGNAAARLEAENRDLRERAEQAERRYAEDLRRAQSDHAADLQELEEQLAAMESEERALVEARREAAARTAEFQKKHKAMIGELEVNLSSTVNQHFVGEAKGTRGLRFQDLTGQRR